MAKADFIKKIAGYAQAEAKKRKKYVLPSVCIAQACLETGYGASSLMTKANAYFGIKWTKGCGFDAYSSATKEVYSGKTCTITAAFRAYKTPADSVADYYDLICGSSRYAAAVGEKDYKKAITAIKKGGYATDPDYIAKIVSIIEANNLTKYDKITTTTTTIKKEQKEETTKKTTTAKKETATKKTEKTIKPGQKVKLKKAKLYATATTKTVAARKTGTFYAWDSKINNGRVRITTSKANVGKANKVTGFVSADVF